jgi:hypothetical protein
MPGLLFRHTGSQQPSDNRIGPLSQCPDRYGPRSRDSRTQPVGFDGKIRWLSRALKQHCVAHSFCGNIRVFLRLSAVI